MTYADRLKIEMYLNDGKTQREIARLMNRHYNTINYEIKRGRTKLRDGQTWLEYDYYSAEIGQQKHDYHLFCCLFLCNFHNFTSRNHI